MLKYIPPAFRDQIKPLFDLPFVEPPQPWSPFFPIPAPFPDVVGFSDDGRYLLAALALEGRKVFDCWTREWIASDENKEYRHDLRTLQVEGIGPLAGQMIRVAGGWGGGFPNLTTDGWTLTRAMLYWPTEFVFLTEPGKVLLGYFASTAAHPWRGTMLERWGAQRGI
jgi:hypothetical protein